VTTSTYESVGVDRRRLDVVTALSTRRALALVGIAAVASALVHVALALGLSSPWIFPDELIYSDLARSIGDGSLPSVRGQPTLGYGLVYPALISPAWAIFDDPARAFVAAKVVNAVVMSLAAFPAFFLARRFVSARSAVVVAALSVFIPSLLFSGTLLIEVVLYPVFILALWAMAVSLQEPTRRHQVAAVAALAVACLTKPLAVVLVPAYVLAVIHLGLLDHRDGGSLRARVRSQSTALGLLATGASVAVLLPALVGRPTAALGVYGVVLGNIDPVGLLVWFVRHVAALDLYVAVAPFVATVAVFALTCLRRADARMDEFTALATWALVLTVAAVAAYASKPLAGATGYIPTDARLHGRNTFVLVPLLLIGMAVFLERRTVFPRRVVLFALGVGVALPFALPLRQLLDNVNTQAPSLIFWTVGGMDGIWPLSVLPLVALVALVFLRPPRRMPAVAWSIVGAFFVVTTVSANASMSHPAGGASSKLEIGYDARWIDHAVPHGADVLALWVSSAPGSKQASYRTIWMNEFYNRSVDRVVELGGPMPYDLPHDVGVLRAGTLTRVDGTPLTARYVLVPCGVQASGTVVAGDKRVGALLYEVRGPVRLAPATADGPSCGADSDSRVVWGRAVSRRPGR
jgi:hypothetical protein